MSKISEHIAEYLIRNNDNEEKIKDFAVFIERFFDDLDEEEKEIKYAFKEDIEDFVLDIDREILEEIIKTFKHKDETVSGLKWSCEEIDNVAKQTDIAIKIENHGKEYKLMYFWFLMNYVYAVHYNSARNVQAYVDLAVDEYCNKIICFKDMIKHLVKYK